MLPAQLHRYGPLTIWPWMGAPDPTVLPRPIPDPHPLPLGSEASVLPSLQAQAGVGEGRDGQGQHSLATGGVHQQRDEGGGSGADAVQGQHGVFALLFTDNVI